MKKNMSALAMSVALAVGTMGYITTAQAQGAVADYTNTIHVTSDNTCDLTVTPPGQLTFNATWTATGTGAAMTSAMAINGDTPAAPPEIEVAITGGKGCVVNQLMLTTTLGAGVTQAPGGQKTYIKAVDGSTNNAYWRFTPYMAKISLYTDSAFTTGETGDASYTAPDGSVHAQNTTAAVGNQSATVTMEAQGVDGILMTDNWFTAGVDTSLVDGGNGVSHILTKDLTATYMSAKLGIGVALSKDPENAAGQPDKVTVANGDHVAIPFTITVSQA